MHRLRFLSGKALVIAGVVALGLCLAPSAAQAQVNFTVGNVPQAGDENVLMNTGQTGFHVIGQTNNTSLDVRFTNSTTRGSEGANLTLPSGGQARVESVDGTLNYISFEVVNGYFTSAVMNPYFGTGTLTVDVNWQDLLTNGIFTESYQLGNGENFSTWVANPNTVLTKVALSAPDGFTDLRQVRIGGAQRFPVLQATPEPASLALALAGLLPLGVMVLKRGKKRQA